MRIFLSMQILSLLIVAFVDSMGNGLAFSVLAVIPFKVHTAPYQNLGLTYEMLTGVYGFCMFFAAPILGEAADKYGRKPILKISMLGLTLGFFCCAFGCILNSFPLILLGRLVAGITAASLCISQASVIDLSSENTKATLLSLILIANCIGFAAGPLIYQKLSIYSVADSGSLAFMIGAFASFFAFALVSFFFEETNLSIRSLKRKFNLFKMAEDIKNIFTEDKSAKLISTFFCFSLVFALFFSSLPFFISTTNIVDAEKSGYLLAILAVTLSIGAYIASKIKAYKNCNSIIKYCSIAQIITFLLLLAVGGNLIFSLIGFIVISMSVGVVQVTLFTVLSNECPTTVQGKLTGCIASVTAVGWSLGAFISDILRDKHYYLPLFLCIFLLVVNSIRYRRDYLRQEQAETN